MWGKPSKTAYRLDPRKVMTEDEVRTCLDWVMAKKPSLWYYLPARAELAFRLAVCCSLRANEAASLLVRDLHLDRNPPAVWVQWGKGKKTRWATIPDDECLERFRWYLDTVNQFGPDELLFQSPKTSRSYAGIEAGKNMTRLFRYCCKPLGKQRTKELSFHCGRHTQATILFRKNYPAPDIRDHLGHSSLATTNVYAHGQPIRAFCLYGSPEPDQHAGRTRDRERRYWLTDLLTQRDFETPDDAIVDVQALKRYQSQMKNGTREKARELYHDCIEIMNLTGIAKSTVDPRAKAIAWAVVVWETFGEELELGRGL